MKVRKLTAIAIAAALGVTAVLTGCGSTSSSSASSTGSSSASSSSDSSTASGEEITFYGVIDPQVSAQQIIADKKGYFAEEGLNIKCEYLQSGTEVSPLIAGGTAKVSCETTYTDIPLAASGVGVKALAPVCNIGDTQCVVAGPKSGIKTPKDMEGKKIGMATGSGVLMAIKAMCEEYDVDFDSLEFVNLQPADQISAIESGDIDVMACWQPWVGKAEAAGGKILFSGMHNYFEEETKDVNWLNFYSTVQVTDDFLASNPEDCKKILKAMAKATDYINENTEDAAKIIAEVIGQDEDEVLTIMKQNYYSMEYGEKFNNACTQMADFMLEQKSIDTVPELSAYTDSSVLKAAVPELVK